MMIWRSSPWTVEILVRVTPFNLVFIFTPPDFDFSWSGCTVSYMLFINHITQRNQACSNLVIVNLCICAADFQISPLTLVRGRSKEDIISTVTASVKTSWLWHAGFNRNINKMCEMGDLAYSQAVTGVCVTEAAVNSGEIWFINFYFPRCSHCHQLAPTVI